QIIEYRVLLDRALEAHRELRLCQEARDAALEYTGPHAAALSLSAGEIDEVAASAEAASRAWDEHARLLIDTPLPSSGCTLVGGPVSVLVVSASVGAAGFSEGEFSVPGTLDRVFG